MVPAGYMYKKIEKAPDYLRVRGVSAVYSVSACISEDFCEWITHWKHNGFWFFNSPSIMEQVAADEGLDVSKMVPFYYRVYPFEWDREAEHWVSFEPDSSFETNVTAPGATMRRVGFDVVTYSSRTNAECSPLSCNHFAETIPVNQCCLFDRYEDAKSAVESGVFADAEPGPLRIIEVNTV